MNLEKILSLLWQASLIIFTGISLYCLSAQFIVHHYRQAQTALTAIYLPVDGFKLNYTTPMMGYPWTVPMELPIFQWLAVLLKVILGSNLIVAGKIINIVCHIANNFLILSILKKQHIANTVTFITLIFYNLFPFYLVFDTVFLVDPLSLTLSFFAVLFLLKFLNVPKNSSYVLWFGFFAALAGLSKSTTFIGVLAPLTGVCLIQNLIQQGGFTKLLHVNLVQIRKIYIAGIAFLLAFTIMYAWVSYSDFIKLQNPFSLEWTSDNLSVWNFGTLNQRLFIHNWKQYFNYHMLSHPIFYMLIVGGLLAFMIFSSKKEKIALVSALLLYLISPLIFFNLFFIHTYYSIANIIFFYFFLALIIHVLISQHTWLPKAVGLALGSMILVFGLYRSYVFRHQIVKNADETGVYGQLDQIPFQPHVNDVIVVIQESRDPYIQYYFKARGINLSKEEYKRHGQQAGIKKFSGGLPVRMICIVDAEKIAVLPDEYKGILLESTQNASISHQPESPMYYNFFWD